MEFGESSESLRIMVNEKKNIEKFVPKAVAKYHVEKKIKYNEKKEEVKEEDLYVGPLEKHIDFKCPLIDYSEFEPELNEQGQKKRLGRGL